MTRDEVYAACLRLVPANERDAIDTTYTKPVYLACASALASVSERRSRRAQASYLLPHSLQTHPPASFAAAATLSLTLERTGSLDMAISIAPRRMVVEGPSGRRYWNVEPIEYARRDESAVREVVFACQVPGEVGNLDFLVNDDLNVPKGKPVGWFMPEHLALKDESRGRSNSGASLILMGGQTTIKDSGRPSVFEGGDEGLYAEILFSATPATIGKRYRIQFHRWPGVEEPEGSNVRPSYAVLDDQAVREQWLRVQQDDGGVFTDYTTAANNQATNDLPLLPAAPAVDDAVYFGLLSQVSSMGLRVDVGAVGEYTLAWEVWDGVTWYQPDAVRDGTVGLTKTGVSMITIGDIDKQVATTVNGINAFWVRLRVVAFTSLTTQPLGGYSYPLCWEPLHEEEGIEWAVRDFKDLGFIITSSKHLTLGRDDDLGLIGDARGIYPGSDEPQEAFRARISKVPDVVAPVALERVVNRILAPLRKVGRVVDLGNEVNGFFLDVDALDYYGNGDVYPTNKWKLLLSTWETYGFFYVQIPWVGLGDFGMFYDEGPTFFITDKGLFIGPAYDDGFYDGEALKASETIYKTIYNEMRNRKAGGVEFALLPDASLNTP